MEICLIQPHALTYTTLVPHHAWIPWHPKHACYTVHCKTDIGTLMCECTLNIFHVTNVNALNPPVLTTVYSLFGPLLRKLQLISLAPDQHQHNMVMYFLLLHGLTSLLTLSRLQESLRNLETTLLHISSMPGYCGTQNKVSHPFNGGLPSNNFYSFQT